MTKRALITGITGQDGSYLTELLLGKGYEVHGIVRRSTTFASTDGERGDDVGAYVLHYGDLNDGSSLAHIVRRVQPDEIYNLGAQSHVRISFDNPEYTADTAAMGALRLLEAVRHADWPLRFYQAGSSEMFGDAAEVPQRETTPFRPRSPYAAAKLFAHWMTVQYREGYGLHASNGILFNHESPRRGATFVTRKITRGIAAILAGTTRTLHLGNLDATRDWGYAPEYVEAMWLMLQQERPDDYVIATGESHSIREFVELAFGLVGLDWREHVEVDAKHFRPIEVNALQGDASKARNALGWSPRTTFADLARIMLAADLAEVGLEDRISV